MAIALRPRASACSIHSRYGVHALAAGARCGRGGHAGGAEGPALGVAESVDTSLAGFAGGWPHRPGRRTATPAAFR